MLSIKGLSAENTQMVQQIIRQSKDESLKKLYKGLLKAKRELAAVYSLSLLKRKEKNINIQTWKRKVSDLELQLAIQSKPLAYKHQIQNTKVTFNDLKHHLDQGGAVIDFVHFRHKDTDSTYNRLYYAMITRHDSQYPVCVRLGTEKELKPFFSKEIKLKGDNYIHDDRVNYDLYQLIWKPLMPHLVGVKEIHLSPDGLLNQLSFEALLSSSESEKRLISKYKLHYYSTLKNFVLPALASDRQKNTQVMLLGGANYGAEANSNDEKSFNYLKGTKEEVSTLAAAFTDARWKVQLLTGDNALEQKVKKVEGITSPRVIHLATHGYFYPPPTDYKKQVDVWINDKNAYQHRIQQHEHPLYRSGLVLTGANLTWTGRPKGTLDLNDGILTAYEVAMLDLYGTELVVLSACETGRGESSETEGVYGLQRAFKQAGVDKLIVSLWKVDDEVTKKFMTCFYKNYLSGLSVNEALVNTKITMQKIYSNPYYWAAFILIE
jgi:CHAT domain-containing protein